MFLLMWQVIDPIYLTPAVFDFAKRSKSYFSSTESTLVTSLRKKEKEKKRIAPEPPSFLFSLFSPTMFI
jgi:hypothetical protein